MYISFFFFFLLPILNPPPSQPPHTIVKDASLKANIIYEWQPTPVFLPGEPQGQGSLMGCRLWGRTESDTTEAT